MKVNQSVAGDLKLRGSQQHTQKLEISYIMSIIGRVFQGQKSYLIYIILIAVFK